MAFGVIVLGVLLGLGGAAVMARGAPYYMLEWGVAYLAAGAIALSTGLILVVLGLVLRRVAAVERQIGALSRAPEIPVAPPVSPSISPSFSPSVPPPLSPAVAAGAVLAPTVAAVGGREGLSPAFDPAGHAAAEPVIEAANPELPDPEASDPEASSPETSSPEFSAPDTLNPDTTQPDLAQTARGILSSVSVREDAAAPAGAVQPAADPFERINRALRDLREGALGADASQQGASAQVEPRAAERETWGPDALDPHADRPSLAEAASASPDDGHARLPEPDAHDPEPEAHDAHGASDLDDLRMEVLQRGDEPRMAASDLATERPPIIPPIVEDEDSHADSAAAWAPHPSRPVALEPDLRDEPLTDEGALLAQTPDDADAYAPFDAPPDAPVQAPDDAPLDAPDDAPVEPAAPPSPAVSEDGVVAAYTVGDSAFTMYADGRIVAETPEGRYSFASMDELRLFMAERRRP